MNNFSYLNVLICDDSITNALILTKLVEDKVGANVITLTDPRKIKQTLVEQSIDLMLLDLEMPHINGFDVMENVREEYEQDQLPIIIITGLTGKSTRDKALINGANDFLNKPIDQIEVELRVKNVLKIRKSYTLYKNSNEQLEKKIQQRTIELNQSIKGLLSSLASAGELKDNETGKHVIRVGKFARIIADGYGLPSNISKMIELTAPLHDIGKIGIPDNILLKPGKLNEQERNIMNKHTSYANLIIGEHESPLIQMAKSIAMSHHECWDGSGYPNKLKEESIPIEGRITAIADVFDALTSNRPYKVAWPFGEAVTYIKDQSNKSFDPSLVEVFMKNLLDIEEVSKKLAD